MVKWKWSQTQIYPTSSDHLDWPSGFSIHRIFQWNFLGRGRHYLLHTGGEQTHKRRSTCSLLEKCKWNYNGVISTSPEWPSLKKSANSKCREDAEKKGALLIAGRNANGWTLYRGTSLEFLKKTEWELHDPTITLSTKAKTIAERDACTPVLL